MLANVGIDLSLVIACYNEEPHLRESISEIEKTFANTTIKYEIIFVDDCSKDRTRDIIKELCAHNSKYSFLFHAANTGRGRTVSDGFQMAKGRYVGFIDIDLEVHARYILSMYNALDVEKYDMATAFRVYRVRPTPVFLLRHLLSIGYRFIVQSYLKLKFADPETGFKFFSDSVIKQIIPLTSDPGWFWDTEVMLAAQSLKLKVKEIPCLFQRRKDKKSTVRLFSDSIRYLVALFNFKQKQIRHDDQIKKAS